MFRKNFLSMVLLLGMLISQSVPAARADTGCDQAQFISDLTVPDGSTFTPGAGFTKTWRLMNIGSCTWTAAYNLVWVGGDSLGAPLSARLPVEVLPGQMVDVSVNLAAPAAGGHYKALFKISNASNVQFGIGDSANDPFWVDINVVETNAMIYDFVANAPYAQWKSGAGLLPYPGTSGDSRGFAYQVNNPHLEDDSLDSSPGLFVVPQNKFNGYIQATYPEFQVQQGDRLQTLVNCEFGATGCYVTFRIDYLLPNGVQRTLWSWKEAYDKRFYRANIDLNSLAGQKVRFVFMLLSSGFASGDRALWGSPRIVRAGTTQPPAPPPTLTPLPPLPPTATPIGQPPPTVAPSGCDRAAFVTDATVPDGTIFSPGAAFTKTWRLKNVGSCAWTTAYKLVYYSGEQMGPSTAVNLPWNAAFDQTVDISVNMAAPTSAGKYRGFWILSNANGQFFGIGANAVEPIWVEINVAGDSPIDNIGYDFTSNVCSAEWKSTVGTLPCPGTDGNANGFVLKVEAPKLEDGTTGGPSLLTVPQNRYNGYIQGFYPTFTVQPGDKFQSTVGCQYGAACYLTYRLDYMTASGYISTFWTWREQNEGKVYNASVDLSPLAGRSVRFILTILATGTAANDRAIWGSPRIVRTAAVTPVPPPTDWLTYTNSSYGFQFKYPPQAQIVNQPNSPLRMNLPFTPGTNLHEKYLEMVVAENANPCQSPLATSSMLASSETVTINGISFLKQTGGDGATGNFRDWVAYSALRNKACVSMDFVLHSVNAGNYETPPPIFDKAGESVVFTQMMSTFGWITPTVTTVPPPVVVPSPQISQLFMLDAANGWALGNSYVIRTTDGGATWYNVSMPNLSSPVSGFFRDANKGWVIATTFTDIERTYLFRTTDGGRNWTAYSTPFNGGSIQFLNDANGFVLKGEGIGMQKFPVSLYQTSDGGATWTLKFAHDPNLPNNGLPLSGHKAGMTFRDTSTGWIGGDSPAYGIYFYKTTNSGVTWAEQSLALPAGYETAITSTTSPMFFGANDAILPVWLGTGVGIRNLFLYVTHDGGTTWNFSSSFAPSSYNADFVSVRDGFSWDPAGVLYVTNNSGTSWTSVTPNVNFGDGIRAFDFVSTTTGWVLDSDSSGNTAFYRTTDGGRTWTKLFGNAATPAPQLLPDLTITQMKIELQNTSCLATGDQMGVRVWIKNNGNAIATSFVVRVNGVEQTANMLGIGETTILFFPGYSNPVNAIVDATNTNLESDENNNTRSEMVAVPTPPLPCVVTPAQFAQSIVDKLNARSFDSLPAMMDQTMGFAYWESQGTSYPSDQAVESLRTGLTVTLIPDASKDLNALLGGLNPYAIMGLDPAKSYGLFVSGWGSDSNAEAILYITQRADGSLYWHSILIAPYKFIHDTPTPATLIGPFAVIGLAPSDVLNIRAGAGVNFQTIGSFPATATNVMRTGPTATADNVTWVEVQNPNGGTGWVNSYYLTEYVTHDAFCADTRIAALIEQLKGSMNQSNGDMFASIISPLHGVNVRLWAYSNEVNFNNTNARNIFTGTDAYNWGGGPSGTPDVGSFKDIIQPKMLEVFNAPNMETYCDNLTKVYPLATPWPYTNVRYYNLYKPASGETFDFRTWLIGFEYINNQPYLHSMVTIVWEP